MALAVWGNPAAAFDRDQEWERGVAAFAAGDFESAWFRFFGLARSGDVESQFNLAQMYRTGRGIPRDVLEAKRWYERAAALGYAPAQFQLGVLWERGDGVPPDLVEARSWFARAAQQNFEPARDALETVEQILAGRGRPLRQPPTTAAAETAATRPNPPARPGQNGPTAASGPAPTPSAAGQAAPLRRESTEARPANAGPIPPTLSVPTTAPALVPAPTN